ncbi:hypothetical protein EDD85DRAFT_436865 [Armillaria nabsnona]|nr:hypothetical protein EDD85DRAFT_436865 [Armillaria nabsnona]
MVGAQITSITVLTQKSRAVIKYLKDVKEAPKECNELLRELRHIEIHLSTVKIVTLLSTAGDPWLMILPQLNEPFKELTDLLHGIEKGLKVTSLWWKRMAPRLQWTFPGESAQEDVRKIEAIGSLIMDVVGQHESLAFSLDVQQKLNDFNDKLDIILNRERDNKVKEVAAWLNPVDYTPIQHDILRQRIMGTGQWFLEAPQFTSWVDGSAKSSTLWCPGDPGSGKTVIASIIAAHLYKRFDKENIPVLRVFGDYQNTEAKTVPDIIRSLLKQLIHLQNGLSSSLESMHKKSLENGPDPSLDEFMEVLSFHLEGYNLIYIVFDAFDEFVGRQEQLISALKSLGSRVRLLVTSRNDTAIQRIFQDDEELRIRADDGDIRKLIMSRLDDDHDLRIFLTDRNDLRQNILTRVVERAQSMFLLADMQMTLLAETADRAELIEELNESPGTIQITYKYFLERVERKPEGRRNLAFQIFGWVAFAERPLTILELQYALAMRPGTTELNPNRILNLDIISRACIGLVVVDGRGYVRFAHPTTRQYFISQKDKLFPGIQEHITRMSLTYMSFNIFHSPDVVSEPDIFAKYPLLNYSSSNWAVHARKCVRGSMVEEILSFLPTQANNALPFEQPPDSEPEIPRTPAWFAAHYGLVNILEALLERGVDLRHENALCIVAHAGQHDMVKLLLSRSEEVDVNQADKVTYLYDYSIDRNNGIDGLEVGDRRASRPIFCTPLIAAASNGHEEIVKLLLGSKGLTSLNFLPPDGPTALSAAIFGNHTGVVKLLLSQPGIDTSIPFLDETPLMLAKRKGRDNIVKMFVEREDRLDALQPR